MSATLTLKHCVGVDFGQVEAAADPDAEFEKQLAEMVAEWPWPVLPPALQSLELTGPRVLVLRDEPETKIGSIHIPDTAQTKREKVLTGTVVRIGDGGRMVKRDKGGPIQGPTAIMTHGSHHWDCPCAVGDRILYGFLDGEDFEHEGRVWTILDDSDVRAIL